MPEQAMQTITMPDGQEVDFPADMPKEQIKAKVLEWYPDAYKGRRPVGAGGRGYDFPGRVMQVGQDIVDLGRGGAQSGAGIVGGLEAVGDLIGLPQGPRHAATREKLEKFAEAPSQSGAQSIGYSAAEVAPWLIPGPGWAAKALEMFGPKAAQKILPTVAQSVRGPGGRFMQNPAHVARKELLKKIGEIGSSLGDVVERASMGAGVGALQTPEDPIRGAEIGGLAMGAGRIPGKIVGPALSWPGELAARGAAVAGTGELIHDVTGLSRYETYPMGGASLFGAIGRGAGAIGGAPGKLTGKAMEKFPGLAGVGVTSTARAFSGRNDRDENNP